MPTSWSASSSGTSSSAVPMVSILRAVSGEVLDASVYTLLPYTTSSFSEGRSHAESHSCLLAQTATSSAATQPEQLSMRAR